MRVILNVDAIQPPLTGIGHYALQLARGLRRHRAIGDVRFFSAYRWLADPEQALRDNRALGYVRKRVPFKTLALHLYNFARSQMFRWQARNLRDYVLHTPNYILMPFPGPAVTTVHDLSYLHYPQHHPRERIAFMERQMPRTLAQAAMIVTDSEFVRRELIERLGISAARIQTVPLGVEESFHPYALAERDLVLTRYDLARLPYLLVVATLEPRKNLPRLVDAYSRLPDALRRRHPLVIAGARGWLTEALERRLEPLERGGQVKRLGYIPQEDLPLLYAGAWAFAFPSIYEGFGLPLLEALRSGVPALTANRSSLPEIAGDAALLVDPEDVDAIAAGLERLLTDEAWRALAVERGLRQAQGFSWERCVEETVAVYRTALEQ
jgi:alpha-1,3-rhamnosyl/mannosyltransferase